MEGHLLTVLICGIGETAKMDREKKKQSFQKSEMTYGQVVQKIARNYQGSTVIWNIGDDKNIDKPLIQYEETDWEFLIRLCSHLHEVIVPDLRTGKLGLHFGMCMGREQNVYLQLDIDEEERADFPWIWANLSYCMPEVGAKAVLYLPTREEKDGRVILATVHNTDNGRYTDVQKRESVSRAMGIISLLADGDVLLTGSLFGGGGCSVC